MGGGGGRGGSSSPSPCRTLDHGVRNDGAVPRVLQWGSGCGGPPRPPPPPRPPRSEEWGKEGERGEQREEKSGGRRDAETVKSWSERPDEVAPPRLRPVGPWITEFETMAPCPGSSNGAQAVGDHLVRRRPHPRPEVRNGERGERGETGGVFRGPGDAFPQGA